MSVVSGVTLVCKELCPTEWIVIALARVHPSTRFRAVEDHFGGGKHPQCIVLGAGINGLDEDSFATAVMAFPWAFPENVVLIIQPEQGPTRAWRPWAPGQPLGANEPCRDEVWEEFVGPQPSVGDHVSRLEIILNEEQAPSYAEAYVHDNGLAYVARINPGGPNECWRWESGLSELCAEGGTFATYESAVEDLRAELEKAGVTLVRDPVGDGVGDLDLLPTQSPSKT